MEFKEIVQSRFSVRNFKSVAIPREKIMQILDTVRLAPSAINYQPWHFIVISKRKNLDALVRAYPRPWILSAPTIIVACINHRESWKRVKDKKDFGDVDVAIAIDHLTLAATSLGLGTCWVCNFDVDICRETLALPDFLEPLALIPIGFPIADPPEKKRKSLDEIVSWEHYYPYK